MSTTYWPALQVLNQAAGELGLTQFTTVVGIQDVQSIQLISLLNSAGNELNLFYPWEQFTEEWVFTTGVSATGEYPLPADWHYFKDQTQWDRTNHWPLLGPKSPQEWAWLKGGLIATAPRIRYRIQGDMFTIWPVWSSGEPSLTIAMEYVSKNWVQRANLTYTDMIAADGDLILYNPWLVIKYLKYKFYELKGFDVTGVQADFTRMFDTLTGKDVGAPTLSLARTQVNQYIGPNSVPDGSWNIYGGP